MFLFDNFKVTQGFIDKEGLTTLNIVASKGQTLDIFVENQGRICYGSEINDNRKVSFISEYFMCDFKS